MNNRLAPCAMCDEMGEKRRMKPLLLQAVGLYCGWYVTDHTMNGVKL